MAKYTKAQNHIADLLDCSPKDIAVGSKKSSAKAKTLNYDANLFSNEQARNSGEVILGVYGIEDWIFSTLVKDRYLKGLKTAQRTGTWLVETSFDLCVWAEASFEKYVFYSHDCVCGFTTNGGAVKVDFRRGKIDVDICGDINEVQVWMDYFSKNYKKAEALIEWVYNARGDDISVPLNYRKGIRAAYPWIDSSYVTLEDYLDDYIDSESSVLILIGPPGTGKTNLIKNLIHRSKANAKVTYDPKIMQDDSFFAGFIDDDSKFLVMEDADEFLRSRADGNMMMLKFLNLADGLISAADKKIVFSTNLPDINDIDEALMRPGRCYDILKFRALDRKEAQAVLDEIGSDKELPDGNEITLAEIFSSLPSGNKIKRRKIGFVND